MPGFSCSVWLLSSHICKCLQKDLKERKKRGGDWRKAGDKERRARVRVKGIGNKWERHGSCWMEKTNEKHSEKPVGREGRWVKTTANLFCVRPCAEQLMGARAVPSNGRSCFGAHTFLIWLGPCCFLCWVLDDTKPLLFMLAAHGRLQAVRIKLQFRICCPGQIRNKIHTLAASVSMPHEDQGFVYNGRIKFCSFWCLHVCMDKTGSVGLILRGMWSSFLVLMIWAVLLDALYFTSISAAAKQLWPFCVTGDFPQALTSCYSLSSPICHY